MKILVAEDDVFSAKFLTSILQKLGHEVISAGNGQDALTKFHLHQPAIVISDWMMPFMDGLQLCQKIRAQALDHYTFFILQTARTSREDYRVAMEAGVDDFLAKPISREELGTRLRVADRMIRQRREAEARIRLLARFPADNPNPVLQVDHEGQLLYANIASLALLTQWQTGVGGAAPDKLRQLVDLLFRTGDRQEVEITSADRVFLFSATSVSDDGIVYLYGHDITERKQAENELVVLKNLAEEHALHDQLTGLPNRRLLTERLQQETARALRLNTRLALVVVDIDNFKQINDGYGHKLGDQVIVTVSHCLREELRGSDTVCRWGGDELVLLLTDLKDRTDIGAICQKLIAVSKKAAADAGITAPVSLSLGSSMFPDDATDPTLLLQQADHALYLAKADGRDCWREFKGFPNGHDAKGKADLFIRLNAAVVDERICTFYQPIIDTNTLAVVGAETMARWQDEHYGWVSPDVFIPLAEEKGLIFQLGRQVLIQAFDQLKAWRERGHELTVSVNLSKRQILDSELRPQLRELLEERSLKPEWIILEVTERQSVLGHPLGQQRLEELAQMGFRLSIDDFGSGYSSFDLVGDTSFSELKIHMGLVRRANTPRGRRIVQAIIEMGRILGLRVVAEGIEDQVTQAMLTALGAHKLQGYLFSRPLQAGAFLTFVDKYAAGAQRAA
jgi:diguanylate cyclase (GGDEF)-like protein